MVRRPLPSVLWCTLARCDARDRRPCSTGARSRIIEIPKGSSNKYELTRGAGCGLTALASAVYYPANYGFIPQTYAEDGTR